MTAFHTMMLSWHGLPEIPSGASVARRLKSRISLRLAAVDCGSAVTVSGGGDDSPLAALPDLGPRYASRRPPTAMGRTMLQKRSRERGV
jgi:hypothetical protein